MKYDKQKWYSYTYSSMSSPFGQIVIPEKFMPHNRGVSSHFIKENYPLGNKKAIVGINSFYFRECGSELKNKVIVAWLNSTIGLALRHESRAELGVASERLSGEQMDMLDFIDVQRLSK